MTDTATLLTVVWVFLFLTFILALLELRKV